jgi:hypothetical protein
MYATCWLVSDVLRWARSTPAPAMTSPGRASSWIAQTPSCAEWHGFEAAIWHRTAALLRNSVAGKFACRSAVSSHKAGHVSESVRFPDRASVDWKRCRDSKCQSSTQECQDKGHHCIFWHNCATCTVFVGSHERPSCHFRLYCTVLCIVTCMPSPSLACPGTYEN